ncbi:MAG: hypothetical protein ACON38_19165, partial [Akkermansiaceae bacterium]
MEESRNLFRFVVRNQGSEDFPKCSGLPNDVVSTQIRTNNGRTNQCLENGIRKTENESSRNSKNPKAEVGAAQSVEYGRVTSLRYVAIEGNTQGGALAGG